MGNANAETNLTKQVAASVPNLDYWLGVSGLGPQSTNFTGFNDAIPSFFGTLANSGHLQSSSWSYTVGAYNRDKAPTSLVLGGYDLDRFKATTLDFLMYPVTGTPFNVAVQKVIDTDTLGGSGINLLPTVGYYQIDLTVPHIWLLDDAIQVFVEQFSLTYDNSTDLFLINDKMRRRMLSLNPTITFFLETPLSRVARHRAFSCHTLLSICRPAILTTKMRLTIVPSGELQTIRSIKSVAHSCRRRT